MNDFFDPYDKSDEEKAQAIRDGLGGAVKRAELWEMKLEEAIRDMLCFAPYRQGLSPEHLRATPQRVVAAFKEYFSGCMVDVPYLLQSSLFPAGNYSQMIHVKGHIFSSVCCHHLALITGTVHFAYLPDGTIIGLSKIPRLIDAYAMRPQVQENMSEQIVDAFMKYVQPRGCGIFVTANHACMQCRGVRSQTAVTDTLALRGSFLDNQMTREEFLMAVYGR